jgi:hypothetical protein
MLKRRWSDDKTRFTSTIIEITVNARLGHRLHHVLSCFRAPRKLRVSDTENRVDVK